MPNNASIAPVGSPNHVNDNANPVPKSSTEIQPVDQTTSFLSCVYFFLVDSLCLISSRLLNISHDLCSLKFSPLTSSGNVG